VQADNSLRIWFDGTEVTPSTGVTSKFENIDIHGRGWYSD
jgi:hypothetical protein